MSEIKSPEIKLRKGIGQREYDAVSNLEKICHDFDGSAFKLELDFKLSENKGEPGKLDQINEFFYYSDEDLIGYIGICDFGGDEFEINGMTHPDYRRQGVFKKLFSFVRDELGRHEGKPTLLLCDKNSEAGHAFIGQVGSVFHSAEHEMTLKGKMQPGFSASPVTLRHMPGFGQYEAQADGIAVGSVRLELTGDICGIYGVEVLPELRGKGYGKGIMLAALEKLREENITHVRLQVDTENSRAKHIYESCGFVVENTMEYYLMR